MTIIPHSDYELIPPGTYPAICTRVVELGKQETNYGLRNQISLAFEPVGVETGDGQPFTVWRHGLTLSTAPKAAFTPILEALLGRPYRRDEKLDLNDLVGMGCEITVEHQQGGDDGKRTFANIAAFEPWPKGVKRVRAQGKMFFFTLANGSIDQKLWGLLSQKMQDKIAASPEYEKIMYGDGALDEDTALRVAKPSRRNGSPPSDYDYYENSRPLTQEEVERMIKDAPPLPPFPTEPPPNYDDMDFTPF